MNIIGAHVNINAFTIWHIFSFNVAGKMCINEILKVCKTFKYTGVDNGVIAVFTKAVKDENVISGIVSHCHCFIKDNAYPFISQLFSRFFCVP
jgi:hypothetical protein